MSEEKVSQLVQEASGEIRQGNNEKAIQMAREALDLDGRSSEAYSVLAIALARAERTEEATDAFQRAIQTNPYNARHYYNLARHYYGQGAKNDAIAMLQEAIRCNGKHRNSLDLLKKIESETHVEVAPYQTSLGDQRGTAYHYKKEAENEEEPEEGLPF